MTNLDKILSDLKNKQEVIINPFDNLTYGNFWFEKQAIENVNSIHQDAIETIENQLKLLKKEPIHLTKSILLLGDAGCGKSHLLGRLKQQLNKQAFFVYIQPIENSTYFWRHTLQYTIASLMQIPQGENESQLRLWLKGLSLFKNPDWLQKLLGEKRAFIRELKSIYPSGIYEEKKFFGVLYELATNNYELACEWLAGEDLDEEDLSILGINKSIDNEKFARGILNNFGRIADATKPIILCFDQIERAFSSVFNFNTTLHNERVINFLILISAVRENWQDYKKTMIQSDLARINQTIILEDITLEEAEKLWINRLKPLHFQCNIQPQSPIAPLHQSKLEENAPGERINLREALNLGGKLFQEYIEKLSTQNKEEIIIPPPIYFLKKWKDTFTEVQEKVNNLLQFSDEEYIERLRYAFEAIQVQNINTKFLPGVNSSKSFTYQCSVTGIKKGIVWNNKTNGKSFHTLMNHCDIAINKNLCKSLFLIRNCGVGTKGTKAFDIYSDIFKPNSQEYTHYRPTIEDLQYLETYYKLAKEALSGDLVIKFEPITLKQLKQLVCQYQVLNNCSILQKVKVVNGYAPPIKQLQQSIVDIVEVKSPIKITELHSKIENIFYDRFIPKLYFRMAIKQLDKNIPFIKIKNPQDDPDEFIIEYKNIK